MGLMGLKLGGRRLGTLASILELDLQLGFGRKARDKRRTTNSDMLISPILASKSRIRSAGFETWSTAKVKPSTGS
jgi:hypothetical protein